MDAAAFTRLRAAFEEALELPVPERDAFLIGALEDAPELLAEARTMLAADAADASAAHPGGAFLEPPGPLTAGAAAGAEAGAPLEVGQEAAGFTMLRLLGRGGMGEVWEAEQARPSRRVAFKVLHAGGLASDERARRRFEDEAELLARLEHPGIARVLASGVWSASDGEAPRPWFALELVPGARPLTTFATELSIERRLRLLIDVCDAVHHGHLRGVVHRDLKPANILVGADGRPRIIDFGIAQAAGERGDGVARNTLAGEMVGTLGYMAPEQIEGRGAAIDARADVFALGVLLFELLVDRTPWDTATSSWAAFVREVTERDPEPPSRSVPGLSRELDWVFARATEKEPERRYASAHALGAELRRFLLHEPLEAGPPTTGYRVAKFARRNRTLVGGVLTALVLACAGAAGTTWGWLRSLDREEQRRLAELRAEERAARATAMHAFLDSMLRAANPLADQAGLSGDTTLAELLLGAAVEVEDAFPEAADLEADTRQLIGVALHGQGRHAAAAEQLARALEAYEALGPGLAPKRLQTLRHLGVALARAGDPAAGRERLAAAHAEALDTLGPEDPQLARIESDLALVELELGRPAEALVHARSAVARAEAAAAGAAPRSGWSGSSRTGAASVLAQALRDGGHPDGLAATERAYRDAVAYAQRDFGPESVHAGITASNLGAFLHSEGDVEGALASFEEAVRLQRAALSADNAYLATPLYNLAAAQHELGRLEDALATIEECFALCERRLGSDHAATLEALQARADVLWWLERYGEARVDFARCAEALASDPAQHDMAVMMELRVLEMRCFGADAGDAERARVELADAIARLEEAEPPSSPLHDFAARTRARVADHLGD